MKLRQLLFVILAFGALTDLSAQALNKTGQIVPTISAQQAAEIKANSLKKGTTAQQASNIINNTAKTAIPAGGAEGQVLKIVQGIAVWMDAPQTNIFYADTDGDGYGAIDNPILFISLPNGCVTNSTDCNDGDSAINPATVWYIGLDTDGDTFFGSVTSLIQCESPGAGYARTAPTTPDCDDNDATINPNMVWYLGVDADSDSYIGSVTQVTQCTSPGINYALIAPIIEDCNDDEILMNPATVWYLDADSDNYAVATTTQCTSPGAGYTATVLPLGDCSDSDAFINPATIWYLDADGDNYAASTITQCTSPGVGYRAHRANDGGSWPMPLGDCNDNDLTINPNNYWYLDADGDNFAGSGIRQCTSPGIGYTKTVLLVTDCNDNDATINPVAVWYLDADGDNYAVSSTVQCAFPGVGYTAAVLPLGDCNENDATINLAAVWYLDADNDSYAASTTIQCTSPGVGYTQTALLLGDCNDNDATMNPATVWYLDADNDSYAASSTTAQCAYPGVGYTATVLPLGDCSDSDAFINPATIWYLDADGDNYAASTTIQCTSPGISYTITVLPLSDCNDNDATFNPTTVWYLDADGDNYAISTKTQCTNPGAGYTKTVLPLSDCNDTDGSINPGNIEDLENGIDDDCDGKIDEVDIGDLIQGGIVFWLDPENNMRGKVCYYKDATDAKIWNNAKTYCNELAVTRNTVLYDDWYLPSIDDLKLMYDNKTTINSTALANLGGSFEDYTYWSSSEFDNWGASIQSFTNGNQAHNVNKGDTGRVRAVRAFCNVQTEVPYDGIDNDCNLATLDDDLDGDGFVNANDCNDSDATINPTTVWYLDADGDNYAISTKTQCANPGAGYTATVLPLSDCNDSDATMSPDTVWYLDEDGDNYAIYKTTQCTSPGVDYTLAVLPLSDCNDSDATINPATIWYLDADADNFAISQTQCSSPGGGYTTMQIPLGDCNDNDGSLNPGVIEIFGDGIDNNCNGQVDEAAIGQFREGGVVFYVASVPTDLDNDGDLDNGLVCTVRELGTLYWHGAISVCLNYSITVDAVLYDDWYLPNRGFLNQMYLNKNAINDTAIVNGGLPFKGSGEYYWSSTDGSSWKSAFMQSIDHGGMYDVDKGDRFSIRAIRAF